MRVWPGPTKAQGPLTSFFPKRNATEHRISSVAGCATGSTRSSSAHGWSGLLSLYFGLFLYQVHIVPTEAGVSRRSACVELPRIPLLRRWVKKRHADARWSAKALYCLTGVVVGEG